MNANGFIASPLVGLLAVVFLTAVAEPGKGQLVIDYTSARLSLAKGVVHADRKPLDGHVTERFADGARKRDANYRNGRLHGVTQGWHPNGQLDYARTYRDGLEEGVHRGWYSSGRRRFAYRYHRGVADGMSEQWYESGQAYTRFQYEDGQELGQQQMWNGDGTLRANYVIRDGRRFGLPGSVGCQGVS